MTTVSTADTQTTLGDVVAMLAKLKVAASLAFETYGLASYNVESSVIEAIVREELPAHGYNGIPALITINNQEMSLEGACALVASILREKCVKLRRGERPNPELQDNHFGDTINNSILRIWQQGQALEQLANNVSKTASRGCVKATALDMKIEASQLFANALISSFKPEAGEEYIAQVRNMMDLARGRSAISSKVQPTRRFEAQLSCQHRGGVPNLEDVQAYPKLPSFLAGVRQAGFNQAVETRICA